MGNSAHVTSAATTAVGVDSTVFTLTPTVIRGAYAAAAAPARGKASTHATRRGPATSRREPSHLGSCLPHLRTDVAVVSL